MFREALSRAAGPKKMVLRLNSLLGDSLQPQLPMRSAAPACTCPQRLPARFIGLIPFVTQVSGPESSEIAEASVRTLKRDDVRVNSTPDARTVVEQLPSWFARYNDVHPHRALRYRSPREFIEQTCEARSGL